MLTEPVMANLGSWLWMEFDFLQRQRPWERVTVIVNRTPTQSYDQSTEIMVAPALH
jgi:hypothetical protein